MWERPSIATHRRTKRLLSVVAALGIALAIVVEVFTVRVPTGRAKRPVPNGYDDLAKAGSLIEGEWPGQGDLAKADPASIRAFVSANRPALVLARVGLGRESLAHFEDSQAGLARQFETQARLKSVARLLTAEGLAEETQGRIAEASRSYLDVIRTGQAITQGEMLSGAQLGWFLQKHAVDRLRKLRDRLPADDCRSIVRDLEALDLRRVPVIEVVARWDRWYRGTFGLAQRAMLSWNGMEATERSNQEIQAKKAHDAAARAMRFLMVELAIHAHHVEKGGWPRSVGELVPAYLAAVPYDPATGKPLDYPANASGELTDDLDSIARPGGEVSPPPR